MHLERIHYKPGEQGVNSTMLLIQSLRAFVDIHYSLLWLRKQEDAVSDRRNAPKCMWTSGRFQVIYQLTPCPPVPEHTTLLDFHFPILRASEKQSMSNINVYFI